MTETEKGLAILRPVSDHREYRYHVLPNKIQAILISDPATECAAASMDVNSGSLDDPEDIQGMAHFLEHMLFLGNERFPDEGNFNAYCSAHSGENNAYTASTNTNFHFRVANDALEGALERFAPFFVSPLLTESAVLREMNAVDAEHSKNKQSDARRAQFFLQHIVSPAHPYHKFSTGSLETLLPQGMTPAQVRERLVQHYRAHYSSSLMCLVVLGREDLDTLQQWVARYFSDVPLVPEAQPLAQRWLSPAQLALINQERDGLLPLVTRHLDAREDPVQGGENLFLKDIPLPGEPEASPPSCPGEGPFRFPPPPGCDEPLGHPQALPLFSRAFGRGALDGDQPLLGGALHGHWLRLCVLRAAKDTAQLAIYFPMPPADQQFFLSKPVNYLGHLIGDEGPGSLLAHLRRLGWASELGAGGSETMLDISFLKVSITLTNAGLEHVTDVITALYQYVGLLHREPVHRWIWDELRQASFAKFWFADAIDPETLVQSHTPPPARLARAHLVPRLSNGRSARSDRSSNSDPLVVPSPSCSCRFPVVGPATGLGVRVCDPAAVSGALHDVPAGFALAGPYLDLLFRPALTRHYMRFVVPQNALYLLSVPTAKEPAMLGALQQALGGGPLALTTGTLACCREAAFTAVGLPHGWVEAHWVAPAPVPADPEEPSEPALHLPTANPFLADDFRLAPLVPLVRGCREALEAPPPPAGPLPRYGPLPVMPLRPVAERVAVPRPDDQRALRLADLLVEPTPAPDPADADAQTGHAACPPPADANEDEEEEKEDDEGAEEGDEGDEGDDDAEDGDGDSDGAGAEVDESCWPHALVPKYPIEILHNDRGRGAGGPGHSRAPTRSLVPVAMADLCCLPWLPRLRGLQFFHKQDGRFRLPGLTAVMNIYVAAPVAPGSAPRNAALADLMSLALTDSLNALIGHPLLNIVRVDLKQTYAAEVASLEFELCTFSGGLELTLKGSFSQKMETFGSLVVRTLAQLRIRPDRFAIIKENLRRRYTNALWGQPYLLCQQHATLLCNGAKWGYARNGAALEEVTLADFEEYCGRVFGQTFMRGLIYGNITAPDALKMAERIQAELPSRPLALPQRLPIRFVRYAGSDASYLFRYTATRKEETNSAVLLRFECEQHNLRQQTVLDLVGQMTEELLYRQLRTVEQLGPAASATPPARPRPPHLPTPWLAAFTLGWSGMVMDAGYIVWSFADSDLGIPCFVVIVQSSSRPAAYLTGRVRAALEQAIRMLYAMPAAEYAQHQATLVHTYRERPKTAADELRRYWDELSSTLLFDKAERKAALVPAISQKECADLLATLCRSEAGNLLVEVSPPVAPSPPETPPPPPEGEPEQGPVGPQPARVPQVELRDPFEFRNAMPMWPVVGYSGATTARYGPWAPEQCEPFPPPIPPSEPQTQ
ncbi:putative A-factor-processing enzyme [Paratrimastix pyriformis]|uniref:A-factor-processing enzyme n=1 Tax=Paratrimastix pyriformis TaxID=342808 RepID=A0ABQ8ULK8_9EUKA|nr:putative A-factor-processing enzyme [Paratrimastix pyriformis]